MRSVEGTPSDTTGAWMNRLDNVLLLTVDAGAAFKTKLGGGGSAMPCGLKLPESTRIKYKRHVGRLTNGNIAASVCELINAVGNVVDDPKALANVVLIEKAKTHLDSRAFGSWNLFCLLSSPLCELHEANLSTEISRRLLGFECHYVSMRESYRIRHAVQSRTKRLYLRLPCRVLGIQCQPSLNT